jgi:hypothetical protein
MSARTVGIPCAGWESGQASQHPKGVADEEFETAMYRAWDLNGDNVVDLHEYKDCSGA